MIMLAAMNPDRFRISSAVCLGDIRSIAEDSCDEEAPFGFAAAGALSFALGGSVVADTIVYNGGSSGPERR